VIRFYLIGMKVDQQAKLDEEFDELKKGVDDGG